MIDWGAVFPVVVGAIVVVAGWHVAHRLNLQREIAAEKRKLRVTYLLEAYRKLEDAGNRRLQRNDGHTPAIESAIADIQLLGTPEQVELAQTFAVQFANEGNSSFDPLLFSLRRSLRDELDLEPVDDRLKFMRIFWDQRDKPS